ncbi:hypothetical protein I600_1156 [Maribacter dokdonensis DSW-8]|nr:hypothetical protein I600_1156 [Maribacter dokdonensis DSW-8]
METTAAIPNIMDAINNSNLLPLALPSRQAIFNNQLNFALDVL